MAHVIVAPTVLATSEQEFRNRWSRITRTSRRVQVDFMDGRFVPTVSVPLRLVPDVHPLLRDGHHEFEAHLMVRDPMRWVPPLLARGFRRFIIHIETIPPRAFHELASAARKEGAVLIAAINPATAIRRLGPYLRSAAGICVLGVRPGHNGAPYDQRTPERVRTIRLLCALAGKRRPIQVDGGMTPQTVRAVVRAGAVRINSGSYVGNAADPAAALRVMRAAANGRTDALPAAGRRRGVRR